MTIFRWAWIGILFTSGSELYACTCTYVLPQFTLSDLQVAIEVRVTGEAEGEVVASLFGPIHSGDPVRLTRESPLLVESECCSPPGEVANRSHSYFLYSLKPPVSKRGGFVLSNYSLTRLDHHVAQFIKRLRVTMPPELESRISRWATGELPNKDMEKQLVAMVVEVAECKQRQYQALITDLQLVTRVNENHLQCAPKDARIGREDTAAHALEILKMLASTDCQLLETSAAASPLDCYVDRFHALFPCSNPAS